MENSRASLIESVQGTLKNSLQSIASVNTDLKVLSINAKIQAARAGALGAGFGVVADGKNTLVYSCGVRENGRADGKLQGVLGVVFNWDALGREVLLQARAVLSAETEKPVKCYICHTGGAILSSTETFKRGGKIALENLHDIIKSKFTMREAANCQPLLIGSGLSRGFETYKTGWASVITEGGTR